MAGRGSSLHQQWSILPHLCVGLISTAFCGESDVALMYSVAVTGFKGPEPTLSTMDKFIEHNNSRKPIFMAWGIFSVLGDSSICGCRKST